MTLRQAVAVVANRPLEYLVAQPEPPDALERLVRRLRLEDPLRWMELRLVTRQPDDSWAVVLERVRTQAYVDAVRLTGGNITRAARRLGLQRTTLHDYLKVRGNPHRPRPHGRGILV